MKYIRTAFFGVSMVWHIMEGYKVIAQTGKLETMTLLYILGSAGMFFYLVSTNERW